MSWRPRQKVLRDIPAQITYPLGSRNQIHATFPRPYRQAPSSIGNQELQLEMLTQPLRCNTMERTGDRKSRSDKSWLLLMQVFGRLADDRVEREATVWPLEPAPVLALKGPNDSNVSDHCTLAVCPNAFCLAAPTDRDGVPISTEYVRGRNSSSSFKLEKDKTLSLQTTSS